MRAVWSFVVLIFFGAIGFVYFSPSFSRIPPKIIINSGKFTNLIKPVKITFMDKTGIKKYKVTMTANGQTVVLAKSDVNPIKDSVNIDVKLPSSLSNGQIVLNITVTDNSKWHFFAGNKTFVRIPLQVDTTPPMVSVVDNSYAIGNGGSAVVVVQISDKNLKSAYILVNNKYKFHLTPFYKKGYYASLIAWPLGNKTKVPKAYILSKVVSLLRRAGISIPSEPGAIFAKANSVLRVRDNDEISKLTSKTSKNMISSFNMHGFKPLPGSALEAYFAEHRMYYYDHKLISQSYHQGIDVARYAHSKVYASNSGKVTTRKWLDLYGNVLIINHKFGLYTLFAHLSSYLVSKGALVRRGEAVARAGATGDAFGPHLHFGVYVQGNAVNPFEWLDGGWIKTNITNVLNKAKKIINQTQSNNGN